MTSSQASAAAFHALHKDFLVLPNAWDAASARVTQDAGAKAIATSSAAVAWAHGYADGHHFPVEKLIAAVEEIARAVSVPITTDAEGGYDDDIGKVAENVRALIDAGAVGINLEDGKQPHELHLRKIEAVRNAANKAGVDLFINARTDVFLKQLVPPEAAVAETLRRAAAIKNAGASGLFAPAIVTPADIAAVAEGAGMPLNVMARPGLPDAAELKALGVKRLSAATAIFNAAMAGVREATEDFLATGNSETLWSRRGAPPDYNKLFGG
ncbi:MAG TPA: isocitrate lyase/phosphoenolpyruvate mutase family protein [Vitreimonas sp.]|uniref:isocitrate lyase/PEP mutase family protein n=1 Tax=Vitreimonas sp. TaxID=3069702 RepID=UPI002D70906D|nr:isocitrate lyase/phosphoenolpyruvate mutase family protein [Vitreimonas sp.]HYD86377.1 isocitrate lyase/phosphoenolpyruvate mutase family protein [Vitreimonas sp.]